MDAAPTERLAEVIQLPVRTQSCFTCEYARFPETESSGVVTYCSVYREVIDSELYAAKDCVSYDRCDEGSQPVEDLDLEAP